MLDKLGLLNMHCLRGDTWLDNQLITRTRDRKSWQFYCTTDRFICNGWSNESSCRMLGIGIRISVYDWRDCCVIDVLDSDFLIDLLFKYEEVLFESRDCFQVTRTGQWYNMGKVLKSFFLSMQIRF